MRKFTHLAGKCDNSTRWSSVSNMPHRYKEIRSYLEELDIDGIDSRFWHGSALEKILTGESKKNNLQMTSKDI